MFFPSYSTLQPQPHDPSTDSLRHKVNHIARMNLKQQDIDICACEECIYTRQLSRKSPIGLDLSKHTSYKKSYQNRSLSITDNQRYVVNPERLSQQKRQHSSVVDSSIYLSNFRQRPQEKVVKSHPIDELKFKGPVKGMSSYDESFFSFKNNANPYVKPVEVFVPNQAKMKLESVYKSNFGGLNSSRTESGKQADHFKGGQPWTGGSTYRQLFPVPQSKPTLTSLDGLSPKQNQEGDKVSTNNSKISQTLQHLSDSAMSKQGSYKHQYETTYRNEYLQGRKRCGRGNGENSKLLQSLQF